MSVAESLAELLEKSGLLPIWQLLSDVLALDARQLIFVVATPLFIAATLWEYRRIRHDPRRMDLPEAIRNFMLGAGYQFSELLFAGLIAFPVYALVYHYRLFDLELSLSTGLMTFIGVELCFYWMHRTSHRVRWFWAAHIVHHSSKRMNFTTAMRQNATNIFNGNWLFYLPLAWLGFNPVWIGIAFALSLVYQFFIHTTVVDRLHPWLEYFLNTPSHHRVHHGRNRGYIDRNFGGVVIIWDRLFGTFADESRQDPPRYGVTTPVPSNGLISLWTHEYTAMFKDMGKSGPIWSRLQHLWRPPEWRRPATDEKLVEARLLKTDRTPTKTDS
jgi:sterol desaturase/sphingolipid hydroxylase (fatty acid hydroxylase superfamily)